MLTSLRHLISIALFSTICSLVRAAADEESPSQVEIMSMFADEVDLIITEMDLSTPRGRYLFLVMARDLLTIIEWSGDNIAQDVVCDLIHEKFSEATGQMVQMLEKARVKEGKISTKLKRLFKEASVDPIVLDFLEKTKGVNLSLLKSSALEQVQPIILARLQKFEINTTIRDANILANLLLESSGCSYPGAYLKTQSFLYVCVNSAIESEMRKHYADFAEWLDHMSGRIAASYSLLNGAGFEFDMNWEPARLLHAAVDISHYSISYLAKVHAQTILGSIVHEGKSHIRKKKQYDCDNQVFRKLYLHSLPGERAIHAGERTIEATACLLPWLKRFDAAMMHKYVLFYLHEDLLPKEIRQLIILYAFGFYPGGTPGL